MGVLIILAIIVRIKVKNFKDVPSGKFQNAIEAVVETFVNLARTSLGEKLEFMGGYFFTIFIFILISNYSGLIFGLRPPTSDLATTGALAVTTWLMIQIVGIAFKKGRYFKGFLEPFPVFLPLNIMGALAPMISLSFRLLGNILGGLIILQLLYSVAPIFLQFVLPAALHSYFDLFSGALQAFVFTLLSMILVQFSSVVDE
jgi:F-type H+-transporting ATPase subunit a